MTLSDVVPAPEIYQNLSFFRAAPDSEGKLHIKYADSFFVPARFVPEPEEPEVPERKEEK